MADLAPFNMGLTWHFVCFECDRHEEKRQSYIYHEPICYPFKPDGWHVVDGYLVCDKHEIIVRTEAKRTVG